MPGVVRKYVPTQSAFGWGIMAFSGLTILLFSRRANFAPPTDSFIHPLAKSYPSIFKACWIYQPWVIGLAIGIHLFEAGIFHLYRLRKFSVTTFSLVWWQWMLSVLVEGMPAFSRIEAIARKSI